jgi:hypothetical protein
LTFSRLALVFLAITPLSPRFWALRVIAVWGVYNWDVLTRLSLYFEEKFCPRLLRAAQLVFCDYMDRISFQFFLHNATTHVIKIDGWRSFAVITAATLRELKTWPGNADHPAKCNG